MDSDNPPFWQNPPYMDFNPYGTQSTSADYRHQQSTQLPYTHPDWPERSDQGGQRIPGNAYNPAFQSSRSYLPQPNTYGPSPPNLVPVQQRQPPQISFSSSDPASVNTDSSNLPRDPFAQSNEEYRRRGGGFPPQHRTTFANQALPQIPPPPALYHPDQPLDHPGGQAYRHQVLPLSDTSAENGVLDLFGGVSLHSRVPSQDGCVN